MAVSESVTATESRPDPRTPDAGFRVLVCYHSPPDGSAGSVKLRGVIVAVALLAAQPLSRGAVANPQDTFGAGSRAAGLAGAATAAASSHDACHYNPAALSRLQGPEAGIGFLAYHPFLRINDTDSPANRTRALVSFGFATPVPLGRGLGDVLFVGVDATLPGLSLYSIRAYPRSEPHFPFLEDRNRRLVLNAAVAVRPVGWLAVGAGFSLLPHVTGDVRVDFAGTGERSYTYVDVTAHLSPNVGFLAWPTASLAVALVWRGANRTRLRIPTSVDVSKIPPIRLNVEATEYSTPHQIALGIAWEVRPVFLSLDFIYSFYRQFDQSSPIVTLYDSTGAVTKVQTVGDPRFHDAVSVRAGAEWHVRGPWFARAGFAFAQSPVPAQESESNLLDGHRFTAAAGAGFDVGAAGGPPIRVDTHVAWTGMVSNRDEKTLLDPANPGYPTIRSGGSVLSGGLDVKMRF